VIIGTGIDIVELKRFEKILKRRGDKFLTRVYNAEERKECTSEAVLSVQRLAGKFAAKEAFMKALGTGLARGVSWQDISVISGRGERPELHLKGRASEIAASCKMKMAHVSISHSELSAVAVVVLEGQ
jgi:holo-[acyl-carrier protein] synthase